MKNKLTDLNDHLFAQLERLNDEDLSDEQVKIETKRGTAIAAVADQIVGIAKLRIEATKMLATHGDRFKPELSALIENKPAQ